VRSVGKIELTKGKVEFKGNSTSTHEISGEGLELKEDAELKLTATMSLSGGKLLLSGRFDLGANTAGTSASGRRLQESSNAAGHLIVDGDSVLVSDGILLVSRGGSIFFNSTNISTTVGLENHGNLTIVQGSVVSSGAMFSNGSVLIGQTGTLAINAADASSEFSGEGVVIINGGTLSASEGTVSFLAEVVGPAGIVASNGANFNFGAGSGLGECPSHLANCVVATATAQDIGTFCSFESVVHRLQDAADAATPFCGGDCGHAAPMLSVCSNFIREQGQAGFVVRDQCASTGVECNLKALVDAFDTSNESISSLFQACAEVYQKMESINDCD